AFCRPKLANEFDLFGGSPDTEFGRHLLPGMVTCQAFFRAGELAADAQTSALVFPVRQRSNPRREDPSFKPVDAPIQQRFASPRSGGQRSGSNVQTRSSIGRGGLIHGAAFWRVKSDPIGQGRDPVVERQWTRVR